MASYAIHDSYRGHLVQDAFLPQHPASMALSAPSGISISLPTSAVYPHDHYNHTSSYYTPRTLAPHPGYLPPFTAHDYPQGEVYVLSSNPTSARGRSASGASTVSVGYSIESPSTTPTSPYLLNGAGNQYPTTQAEGMLMKDEFAPSSQLQLSSCEIKQELPSVQRTNSNDSAKTFTDDRVCCLHRQCQDENGQPRKFFSRKADVNRHVKSQHEVTYIDCPKYKCERKGSHGFTRQDHLTEHLRGFHMVNLPKRQALIKAKAKKEANDNKDEHISAREAFAPVGGNMPTSHSRRSSFVAQAEHGLKEELPSPSAEDIGDEIQPEEDYQRATTSRAKRVTPRYKIKLEVARQHPYARRPSNNQPRQASPETKCQEMSPHASVSPHFRSPRMIEHSPVYASHRAMVGPYTTDHMISSIYAPHHDVNDFYSSSMGQPYHGIAAPHSPPYHGSHAHNFHFQTMHD